MNPVCFLLRQKSPIQKSATPQGLPPPTQQIKIQMQTSWVGRSTSGDGDIEMMVMAIWLSCFDSNVCTRLLSSDCFRQIVYTSGILGIDHATGKLIEGVRLQVLSSAKKIERSNNHQCNKYKYNHSRLLQIFLIRLAKCLKTWRQSSRWWMPTWRGAWRRPATWPTLKMLRLC